MNCRSSAALSGAAAYGLAERIDGSIYNVYLSGGVPSARLAEEGGILCFYSAAERLLKKAGYETALTRWGGASQTPVLVYVLVAAAAVLVIVLIVLLCGMKKRPREK